MILKPVGIIHSPFKEKKDSPHQGRFATEVSEIEILKNINWLWMVLKNILI